MNSVIIHTLRTRNIFGKPGQGQGQSQNEGQGQKIRSAEKHTVVTLLLVTFVFLILSTPSYVFLSLMTIPDNSKRTPFSAAIFSSSLGEL